MCKKNTYWARVMTGGLAFGIVALLAFVLCKPEAEGQIVGEAERNMSKMANYQNECSIAKNPNNKFQLFALCNNATGGLFAARSTDLGTTWTYPDPSKTIANGTNPALGPAACCDPSLAWDTFGNLFIAYLGGGAASGNVVLLISTDGGLTFSTLQQFGPASVDQPTVTADAGQVWVVWNEGSMVAQGAPVTGLGAAHVGAFTALQTIPGTSNCSFGDVAISPGGAVVQVCETPTGGVGPADLLVNIKADGVGPNPFGAAITATATNVGGFMPIPAQSRRTIDAEAGLAYDRNPASPHFRRLYLVYTDAPSAGNASTQIMLRFSDNDGAAWSAPIRVDDDLGSGRSKFLPRISSNRLSGNIAVCWHDARNSATNTTMQEFCTIATPTGASPTFIPNGQVSAGTSNGDGSNPPQTGQLDIQFGDYSGLAYHQGRLHPAWADDSNSTGDNPDGTNRYDAYTNRVTGGSAANEGDPHLTTVNGVRYDFQGAGEFIVLRDYDGLEIQTRQSPIATTFSPGTDAHDGLSTCVSLNTAMAARIGSHRVSYEPNLSGVPDPSGLQLRVDGALKTLAPAGIDLGNGGRIAKTTAPGGLELDFPDGTVALVTPGWWDGQKKWYLDVNVTRTPALEGVMGTIPRGGWLPSLPDGAPMGPLPSALHERFVALYDKFANAWRVSSKNSLFDYSPGTSTDTFTMRNWPVEKAPCLVPNTKPLEPVNQRAAQQACRVFDRESIQNDCAFDLAVTGDPGFARTYHLHEQLYLNSTVAAVSAAPARVGRSAEPVVMLTASIEHTALDVEGVPTGTVQFMIDGVPAGRPVKLDANGQATLNAPELKPTQKVTVVYTPSTGSKLMPSTSPVHVQSVPAEREEK